MSSSFPSVCQSKGLVHYPYQWFSLLFCNDKASRVWFPAAVVVVIVVVVVTGVVVSSGNVNVLVFEVDEDDDVFPSDPKFSTNPSRSELLQLQLDHGFAAPVEDDQAKTEVPEDEEEEVTGSALLELDDEQ